MSNTQAGGNAGMFFFAIGLGVALIALWFVPAPAKW